MENNLKLIKQQILSSLKEDKWHKSKNRHGEKDEILWYNSLDDNSTIRLKYRSECSMTELDDEDTSLRYRIGLKHSGYWKDFNALHYGFTKFELYKIRRFLKRNAILEADMEKENAKIRNKNNLIDYSSKFISENKEKFRDSKINEIIK
jgi:hypothetical protein